MIHLLALVLFPALMAYAAATDLLTMTIPNRISLALVAAFPVFAVAAGMSGVAVAMHVGAGALVLAVCFGMFAFGWIGGGDAKLASATALWLGFETLSEYLLLAALGGGMLTILILVLRGVSLPGFAREWVWLARLHDRRGGVPYGIALAGAAVLVYADAPVLKLLAA